MASLSHLRVNELKPGDRIRVVNPLGEAEVIRAFQTEKTRVGPGGRLPGSPADGIAWIVDFKMTTGVARGRREHTFQHPHDRIQTP